MSTAWGLSINHVDIFFVFMKYRPLILRGQSYMDACFLNSLYTQYPVTLKEPEYHWMWCVTFIFVVYNYHKRYWLPINKTSLMVEYFENSSNRTTSHQCPAKLTTLDVVWVHPKAITLVRYVNWTVTKEPIRIALRNHIEPTNANGEVVPPSRASPILCRGGPSILLSQFEGYSALQRSRCCCCCWPATPQPEEPVVRSRKEGRARRVVICFPASKHSISVSVFTDLLTMSRCSFTYFT